MPLGNKVTHLSYPSRVPKLVVLSIVVCLATLSGTHAQDRQRPSRGGRAGGFGGFGRIDTMRLIRSQQVQEELKVTESQKEKIQGAEEEVRREMRDLTAGLRELSGPEREKKIAEIRQERTKMNSRARKVIKAVLNADQVRRLDEINLQLRGVRALVEEDVAGKLEISDQQQETIKKIFGEQEKKARELFQTMSNLRREERGQLFARRREMQTATESNTLEVLTQEQRSAFDKLKGARFDIDHRSLFGGFGGGSGRPGGEGEARVRPPAEP